MIDFAELPRVTVDGERMMEQSEVLSRALVDFRTGAINADEFSNIFFDSNLYCQLLDPPAFSSIGLVGHGFVPVYSSPAALARQEGACQCLTASAEVMLSLVPDGYGIVIDLGSDDEVVLPDWAIIAHLREFEMHFVDDRFEAVPTNQSDEGEREGDV